MVMMIHLFRQYCTGIQYMHDTGFAHCDIKPANVLLDLNNQGQLTVAITDFGITRIIDQSVLQVSGFQSSQLQGASIAFAAPEVLTRFRKIINEQDARIWKAGDVFALSASLLNMLKRQSPWM